MNDLWYKRYYECEIKNVLKKGKVFVLEGPRRVGKTELIKRMLSSFSGKIFSGTGDDITIREILSSQRLQTLVSNFNNYDVIFIDEAQKIPSVGNGLKLLIDNLPDTIVIATGSASFDLSNKIGEPLTGRQIKRKLYPVSVLEFNAQFSGYEINKILDELLIFGSYPEVLKAQNKKDKIEYLISIRDSYLLKDVLEIENVRHSAKLYDLLKLLAFQIGSEVSLNELSNNLEIAKQSVERYLYLLEKAFTIKRVGGFSRNLRKEVMKTSRYYFIDNGIRNAVINNFNDLSFRDDQGKLWENFLFIERLKKKEYKRIFCNDYFWRTYDKKEINLIEEGEGELHAFEFKYGRKKMKAPRLWSETYPGSKYKVISKENFLEFLT
ncbi:hypothetical protein BMS3Abin03_02711 [bacterium BMS3Abin03]|nr:hypothetical protein BMS3Abin03_02711 [bacterium BMS3Abin03]